MKALLLTELRVLLRDHRATLSGILMVFLLVLSPHLVVAVFGEDPVDLEDELRELVVEPVVGELGWTVAGPRPAWLDPDLGTEAPPEALVRFWQESGSEAGVHFEVLGLTPGARLGRVADAVKDAAFAERQSRAEHLGLVGPWRSKVRVRFVESAVPKVPFRLPTVPLGAALVLTAGVLGSLSWLMEALPRARSGGWLESLAALPPSRLELVGAWVGTGALLGLGGAAVGLAAHALGAPLSGEDAGLGRGMPWIPLTVALLVPPQLLIFLTAGDLRASVMRSLWALPGLTLVVLLAMWVAVSAPGWLPWIPVGGLVMASLGLVGPAGVAPTLLVGLATAGAATWACVALLEGSGAEVSTTGRTAERRARGNWLPEALLLVCVAMASSVSWSPGLWGDQVARVLITSQVLFFAAPALASAQVLGLPARELLPRRWPGAVPLLLAVCVAPATLTFGVLATTVHQVVAPFDPFWAKVLEEAILPLSGGLGLALIALLPGICEELLFRGVVFSLLRRGFSDRVALVLQAALFAVMHLYLFRWLPTFGLGLAAGWLVLRTGSLLPAMVLHVVHNALAVHLGAQVQLDLLDPVTQGAMVAAVGVGVTALASVGRDSRAPRRTRP